MSKETPGIRYFLLLAFGSICFIVTNIVVKYVELDRYIIITLVLFSLGIMLIGYKGIIKSFKKTYLK